MQQRNRMMTNLPGIYKGDIIAWDSLAKVHPPPVARPIDTRGCQGPLFCVAARDAEPYNHVILRRCKLEVIGRGSINSACLGKGCSFGNSNGHFDPRGDLLRKVLLGPTQMACF